MRCEICDYNEDTGSGLLEHNTKIKVDKDSSLCYECDQAIKSTVYYNELEQQQEDGEVSILDEDITSTPTLSQ